MADKVDMATRDEIYSPGSLFRATEVTRPDPKVVTRVSSRRARRGSGLGWRSPHALVGCVCALAIGFGWNSRGNLYLSPSDGLGYLLGIVGLAMMVLLLGYSLRKRSRLLRSSGLMRDWFEVHLILGLLGPTVILYHSNFSLGSANATISLLCVLAVSGSGVGGRFLYGRMHRSMAGERRSASGIRKQADESLVLIAPLVVRNDRVSALLADFEAVAMTRSMLMTQGFRVLTLRLRAFRVKRKMVRLIRTLDTGNLSPVQVERALSQSLSHLCRAAELTFFEQLFSLWHAIHVPLTVILFLSAGIHVVAVHLF